MKRLLQYFILLQFVFIIFSCSKNPVKTSKSDISQSESDSVKFYTVSGIVLEHVYAVVSPSYRAGVPVVLDTDTTITDSSGNYSFNNVTKGDHIISVSLPEDRPYLNTITVLNDTIFYIHLYGLKPDYFPIKVNTQKRFEYYSCNGIGGVCDTGKALWSIDSLKEENGISIYSVKETLIYASTFYEQNPQLDTVITQFRITENDSHIITIKLQYPWNDISFNRYLDPRQGEIIELSFPPGQRKISLKKNVGLYNMHYYDSAHLWSVNYQLIE